MCLYRAGLCLLEGQCVYMCAHNTSRVVSALAFLCRSNTKPFLKLYIADIRGCPADDGSDLLRTHSTVNVVLDSKRKSGFLW